MDNRYEIRCKIGVSTLGTVYRGFDRVGLREVAIKRFSTHRTDGFFRDDPLAILSRQAEIQSSVGHPSMVRIHDIGRDGGDTVLVMDYVEGDSLDHRLDRSVLEWDEFRLLATATLEGLAAAHDSGVIHGDIKPSNLMTVETPDGHRRVRILDFGLADLINPHPDNDTNLLELPLDSLHCHAPERFARNVPSVAADLYAFGCVCYLSLAGRHPFDGHDGNRIMDAHLHHFVTNLADHRPDLPPWVCPWVMWLINRMPDHRPVDAHEALDVFLANEKAARGQLEESSGTI
jgi:eukaryotic-like serine/threonine-protein kinase